MENTLKKYSSIKHKQIYFLLMLFVALTIAALVVAFQHRYIIEVGTKTQYSLKWHIPFNLFYWWCWLLFFPAIYWSAKKVNSKRLKSLYWLVFYLLLPILLVLLHQVIAAVTISLALDIPDLNSLLYKRIVRNYWIWVDIFIYYTIMIGTTLFTYKNENKEDELKISQLRAQLINSQLNALKSQLHPHFLFNTLNTISTLILKGDNAESERMLSLLKNLLHTTVNSSDKQEITLEDELRFINHYLDIEKIRFKDKLNVYISVPDKLMQAAVPNFILQPIIENAIHHAIAQRVANGIIEITAESEDDKLRLIISDNGPGLRNDTLSNKKHGVGFKNTRERLAHLYDSKASFLLDKSESGGLKVSIEFPLTNFGFAKASV